MAAGDRIFMAKESTSQEILSNTKKIIEDAKAKPKRYGMRINLLDSNPATRVKYLYDAVGMTPAGMNFAGGGFDYGDWGDIWFVKKNRLSNLSCFGMPQYIPNRCGLHLSSTGICRVMSTHAPEFTSHSSKYSMFGS